VDHISTITNNPTERFERKLIRITLQASLILCAFYLRKLFYNNELLAKSHSHLTVPNSSCTFSGSQWPRRGMGLGRTQLANQYLLLTPGHSLLKSCNARSTRACEAPISSRIEFARSMPLINAAIDIKPAASPSY